MRDTRCMERETLIGALKALSDLTRLSIFEALMEGIHCNCEIAERLGLSLSLISHHLHVLQQVDLISGQRADEDARWIYYSVNEERLTQLNNELCRLLDAGRIQSRTPSCGPASNVGE